MTNLLNGFDRIGILRDKPFTIRRNVTGFLTILFGFLFSSIYEGQKTICCCVAQVPPPAVKLPKNALGVAGITYIPKISDTIKRQLRNHAPDLKIAPRPPNKVGQVFTDMKQKLETGQNSFVVYKIPCRQCQKWYFGETTRLVYERCEQHEKDVANISKKPKKTALVAHVHEKRHEFDFTKVEIVKKVRAKGLLKIHEANQIILHEEVAVNFKKDAKHVSPVVYNLIKRSKVRKKHLIGNTSTVNQTDLNGPSERSSNASDV